jgi:hypothetical protein
VRRGRPTSRSAARSTAWAPPEITIARVVWGHNRCKPALLHLPNLSSEPESLKTTGAFVSYTAPKAWTEGDWGSHEEESTERGLASE